MEVVAADDDGAGHLGGDDTAGEDAATDGDIAREGALLVYPAKPQTIVNPGIRTLSKLRMHAPM